MLNGLCQGHLLVLFTSPDTEAILAAMERYQATVFYGVPTLYEYLKDHKDTDKANWKRLKLILSGADTLHESTMNGWARRTGSKITEGYGMSETAAISHINPLERPKPGSFGCPVPSMVEAAVIDPETLEFVAAGRNRRAGARRAERDARLLEPPGGNARRPSSSERAALAAHRRHRAHGRGRLLPLLRPLQGPDQVQGLLDLRQGRRGRALRPSAGQGGGRDRRRRPGGRPAHQGDRGAAGRRARQGERGRDQGLLPAAASPSTRCRTSSSSAASCRRPTSARSRAASCETKARRRRRRHGLRLLPRRAASPSASAA